MILSIAIAIATAGCDLHFDTDNSDEARKSRCSPDRIPTLPSTISPRARNGESQARPSPRIPALRNDATSPVADQRLHNLRLQLIHRPLSESK